MTVGERRAKNNLEKSIRNELKLEQCDDNRHTLERETSMQSNCMENCDVDDSVSISVSRLLLITD